MHCWVYTVAEKYHSDSEGSLVMAKTINRYFKFLSSSSDVKPSGRLWLPAADIYETPFGWIVKVELAGVVADDLELEVVGNSLCVAGTRKDRTCADDVSYHQMEITYSRFEKTLTFPEAIEGASIEHSFDNGLLMITLHRA
jgi:HSP20 family protein